MTSLRDVMYGLMRDLTQNQSRIYDVLQNLDDRQNQLTNQQKQITDQRQQLIEILKILNKKIDESNNS